MPCATQHNAHRHGHAHSTCLHPLQSYVSVLSILRCLRLLTKPPWQKFSSPKAAPKSALGGCLGSWLVEPKWSKKPKFST